MKFLKFASLTVAALSVVGCVSVTPDIGVQPKFMTQKDKVIGVAVAELPKPMTYKVGNQGLLDVVINNAAASDLDKHLAGLDISRISDVGERIAKDLEVKGFRVKRIQEPVGVAALAKLEKQNDAQSKTYFDGRDFSGFKAKYGVDKLVLLSVGQIGTQRSYYGFIPTSDPVAVAQVNGRVIDLASNQLEWNQTVMRTVPSNTGTWDEPPAFPGLTKAMNSAYDQVRTLLYNSFAQ